MCGRDMAELWSKKEEKLGTKRGIGPGRVDRPEEGGDSDRDWVAA